MYYVPIFLLTLLLSSLSVAVDGLEYGCDPVLGANPGADSPCGTGDDEITVHINDNGTHIVPRSTPLFFKN